MLQYTEDTSSQAQAKAQAKAVMANIYVIIENIMKSYLFLCAISSQNPA